MVTRLVLAKVMQVGMKAGQKALRNRKSARVEPKDQNHNLDKPSNDSSVENGEIDKSAMRDVTDKGVN